MDDPVWLQRLRLALRLDELVPAEPVKDLIQAPDVQPAPQVSDGLLEAPLQFVTVRGLVGQQRQDCVMQRHGSGRSPVGAAGEESISACIVTS
jgi:hypothetical protein